MKPFILDEHTAAHVAELFRAFSDTSRIRILSVIVEQEMNVSTLAELVGDDEGSLLRTSDRQRVDGRRPNRHTRGEDVGPDEHLGNVEDGG